MSLNRMLQVLLPQPGDDLRSWASSLVAQLQFLLQQQANDTQMLSSAPATAPLYQSDGNTLVITDVGEYKLADGTVIVDATGLHVKDATGFDVINGPTIRIDTQHLVDAAIETAKLAAGAVTNTIIADNSISTGKLQANSVVAGKIAANAIVADDGVIGNAAIVNAQIANLDAAKINAGDIAAARMSTNIVTALEGKFATLSALAASLGVVSIQSGGALLTQGVTNYSSGTGLWTGETGGLYKFRIGNPAGARLDWDGSSLNIYTAANQLVLKSGAFTLRTNQIAPFNFWTMNGSNFVNLGSTWSYDGTTLVIPSGSNSVTSDSPAMDLSGQGSTFIISFKARGSGRTLTVDLFPDTLPESSFLLTGDWEEYSATWTSTHADLASCVLRFFADSVAVQVEIADVMLTISSERTLFVPHVRAGVGVRNPLTASNVSTYMANATIGTAQIIDANITTAKIGTAQVDTLQIAGNAVTVPVHAYTAGVQSFSTVYVTTQSASITAGGQPVTILFFCRVFPYSGGGAVTFRVLNPSDVSILEETMNFPESVSTPFNFSYQYSQDGTYSVQVQATANCDISKRSLILLGTKR